MLNEKQNQSFVEGLFNLMSFCPKWVFEAACAAAATEYLSRQLDLNTVASGYAATLI